MVHGTVRKIHVRKQGLQKKTHAHQEADVKKKAGAKKKTGAEKMHGNEKKTDDEKKTSAKRYRLVKINKTWISAEGYCRLKMNGSLVAVRNAEEQHKLKKYLSDLGGQQVYCCLCVSSCRMPVSTRTTPTRT